VDGVVVDVSRPLEIQGYHFADFCLTVRKTHKHGWLTGPNEILSQLLGLGRLSAKTGAGSENFQRRHATDPRNYPQRSTPSNNMKHPRLGVANILW
jgi:hypothetical protein